MVKWRSCAATNYANASTTIDSETTKRFIIRTSLIPLSFVGKAPSLLHQTRQFAPGDRLRYCPEVVLLNRCTSPTVREGSVFRD